MDTAPNPGTDKPVLDGIMLLLTEHAKIIKHQSERIEALTDAVYKLNVRVFPSHPVLPALPVSPNSDS